MVIQAEDGRYFHEACFPHDLTIQQQIAAKEGLAEPTFHLWKPGQKPRCDDLEGDADFALHLQAQILAGVHIAPRNNNLTIWEIVLFGAVGAIILLSFVAYLINASVQFSNPALHFASLPFYMTCAALLVVKINELCAQL